MDWEMLVGYTYVFIFIHASINSHFLWQTYFLKGIGQVEAKKERK